MGQKEIYEDFVLKGSVIKDSTGHNVILGKIATFASLPTVGIMDGDTYLVLDEDTIYEYNLSTTTWLPFGDKLMSYVSVKSTATQALTKNVVTKLTFNTVATDANSEWSSNRFTAKAVKVVIVYAKVTIAASASVTVYIYKNGVSYSTNLVTGLSSFVLSLIECVVGDYIEAYAMSNGSSTTATPFDNLIIKEIPNKGGK